MFDYRRSHTCGQLRSSDTGTHVTLSGWVDRRRDHGGLIFIDLRDRYGITQIVFDPETCPDAKRLRMEWVISVRGQVVMRGEGLTNPKLPTGEIEIASDAMEVLSKALTPPFSICDDHVETGEEVRLKHRFLDIRRGKVIDNLLIRHRAATAARSYLNTEGFCEVQTPILGKSTPEGARDYLVPSRIHQGHFYALPQSPQIFKQLLMVSGLDRYYQIAACFRDEDLRADRQPEFTQIDIEASFLYPENFFAIIEKMMAIIFEKTIDVHIQTPFRHLSYAECIKRYGTDKPDLRFGMELVPIDDIARRSDFKVFHGAECVKGLCVKGGADISRKGIDSYTAYVGQLGIKGLAWMKVTSEGLSSNIVKFFSSELQQELIDAFDAQTGDLLFFVADETRKTNQALDHLRRKLARDRRLIDQSHYEFLWVREFPLFTQESPVARLETEHHPFTSPHPEDLDLLDKEPLKVRSSSYDLVLNGYELASGSQRIHDSELQKKIFQLLQLTPEEITERFGFFVEALQYGTPPHLGIAVGLDRLIMILCDTENIRDVIAFPKTQKATDLMMDAPSPVDMGQLDELRIEIKGE